MTGYKIRERSGTSFECLDSACYSHSPTHSPPTPLHRQIKVLHEALARIFFNEYAERLTQGQGAFLPIHQIYLMGVQ